MPKYVVVAVKSSGLYYKSGRPVENPFSVAVFDPNAVSRKERRTWPAIQAESEDEVRRLFAEAEKANINGMRGFKIVSVTVVAPAPKGETG